MGVLLVVVGCDDVVVGGWVTGAGDEVVVGAGDESVVTAAPPLLELPLLELPLLEPLELPDAVVAVLVLCCGFLCCCFFLAGSAFFVVAVVGVVAAAFVVELDCEAAPPQPATARAITIVGRAFLIRRVPPR
ncbi:MAG TPA: hypothetical protein VGF81_00990 [Solirubrobacteraceae bacterium]